MNDRHKYRAWVKKEKKMYAKENKMYEVDNIDFEHSNIGINCLGWIAEDECVLMQSTGLKDKTSKLIFEGDIVKIDSTRSEEDFSTSNYMAIVKSYEDGEIIIEGIELTTNIPEDSIFNFRYGGLEIIGNIYENSDLLVYLLV